MKRFLRTISWFLFAMSIGLSIAYSADDTDTARMLTRIKAQGWPCGAVAVVMQLSPKSEFKGHFGKLQIASVHCDGPAGPAYWKIYDSGADKVYYEKQ